MLSKAYRLSELQVKKVLSKGKPFFSSVLVLNSFPNTLGYNRFAIVISGKSTSGSVARNYFRRFFYRTVRDYRDRGSMDLVFVVKSKNFLDFREKKVSLDLKKDILFLLSKIK